MELPKTYAEAIAMGYTDADEKWQRGYVSRKSRRRDAEILVAGGRRKGQLYVLCPTLISTAYCIRQYLYPPTR